MRRSFQVATVFTGVAAIAGGFGPAALAATTKTPDAGITPTKAGPTALAPTTKNVTPAATTTTECGANTGGVSRWAHIFYPNNDHPAECIHGSGTVAATGNITAICPGAVNISVFGKLTANGDHFSLYLAAAPNTRYYISSITGYRTNLALSKIAVHDTGGSQKCTS